MTDPHEAAPDEDPEQHIGSGIPDPWADNTQTDWETTSEPEHYDWFSGSALI